MLWETDEDVPLQDFAITQQDNPYKTTRLLLDGQQRLTSLSAVIRGDPVTVRGRRRPIELLFNLEHPESLAVVTEVNEDEEDEEERIGDEIDSTEDELQTRFDQMTFVVGTPEAGAVTTLGKSLGGLQERKRPTVPQTSWDYGPSVLELKFMVLSGARLGDRIV